MGINMATLRYPAEKLLEHGPPQTIVKLVYNSSSYGS